ncbi:MAG: PD-(D/E)XK motif protein [Micrococcus sp.]|nr:PD-(D/E)XK motif protein [Micrococcus sp.]
MNSTNMTPERQFARLVESRQSHAGRILGIEHPQLRLFAHDRDGRLILRVLVPDSITLPGLVSTRGIEVDAESQLGDEPEIAFISRNPALDTIFLSFVRFAVDRTAHATDERGALRELADAYNAFRKYMESDRGLSPEALKGLVAELVVMRWLIDRGFDPASVLSGWKGPFKENKDFVLPDGRAFEVKSAPYNSGGVRISSPDQLEPNGLDLALCVVRMEKAVEGMDGAESLAGILDKIVAQLSAAGADSAVLEVGLEAYGLQPDDEVSRESWFACRRPMEYVVADGFPRISRSSVPPGVSGVSFVIGLSALESFQIAEEEPSDDLRDDEGAN